MLPISSRGQFVQAQSLSTLRSSPAVDGQLAFIVGLQSVGSCQEWIDQESIWPMHVSQQNVQQELGAVLAPWKPRAGRPAVGPTGSVLTLRHHPRHRRLTMNSIETLSPGHSLTPSFPFLRQKVQPVKSATS